MAIAAVHSVFRIDSDSKPGVQYRVDVEAGTCSCPSRRPCKHLQTARQFRNLELQMQTMLHFVTPMVSREAAQAVAPAVDSREAGPMAESPRRGRRNLYGTAAI